MTSNYDAVYLARPALDLGYYLKQESQNQIIMTFYDSSQG